MVYTLLYLNLQLKIEVFVELVQSQQKLQFLIEDLNKVMYKPLDELFEKYGNK